MPKWIGKLYSQLYGEVGHGLFTFNDLLSKVRTKSAAKQALSGMRRVGAVFLHGVHGRRRLYRVCDPNIYALQVSGLIKNLTLIPQQRYCRLIGLFCLEAIKRRLGIISVVVFGSVARGFARIDSDVDLLVVVDGFKSIGSAIDALVEIEMSKSIAEELDWLEENGVLTHLSFHPLTSKAVKLFPPILLDVLMDGIIVYDDEFFERVSEELLEELRRAGARREEISRDEWYWILPEELRLGGVAEP